MFASKYTALLLEIYVQIRAERGLEQKFFRTWGCV